MACGMRWTAEQYREFEERGGVRTAAPRPAENKPAMPAGKAAELSLRDQIVAAGLPEPFREFTFHPTRDWRLDLAWPDRKLAIEIDGAVHRTKERFAADMEKFNEAGLAGWTVIRVTPEQVSSGHALAVVGRAFAMKNVRAPAAAESETFAEVSAEHVAPQRSASGVVRIQSAPKQRREIGSKRTGS